MGLPLKRHPPTSKHLIYHSMAAAPRNNRYTKTWRLSPHIRRNNNPLITTPTLPYYHPDGARPEGHRQSPGEQPPTEQHRTELQQRRRSQHSIENTGNRMSELAQSIQQNRQEFTKKDMGQGQVN